MNKPCIFCGEEIHPMRLKALPLTKTCVNCSKTGSKKAVTVSLGEGDHNYNDIVILDEDEYEKYVNLLSNKNKDDNHLLEVLDLDKDEKNLSLKDVENDSSFNPTSNKNDNNEDEEEKEEDEEENIDEDIDPYI
jgi:hypothetical protein